MNELAASFNDFLKEVELLKVRLGGLKFSRDDSYFVELDDENGYLKHNISFAAVVDLETEERFAFIDAKYTAKIKKGRKVLVDLQLEYELAYKLGTIPNDEILKLFTERVVRATTYPYFRQYLNQISNDADLDMPVIPMLKLPPINGIKSNEK